MDIQAIFQLLGKVVLCLSTDWITRFSGHSKFNILPERYVDASKGGFLLYLRD